MTEQELLQENQKLNARLQKAVSVFGEQKATIERLSAERDAAIAKTAQAEEQDQLFFEQQQEIETLKSSLEQMTGERDSIKADYAALEQENEKTVARLEKATEAYKEQKKELEHKQNQCEKFSTAMGEIFKIASLDFEQA